MKSSFLMLLFISFILFSCEKEDKLDVGLSKNPPETPGVVSYDLNDDSVDDFKIEYRLFTWDGINCSGDGISGLIEPLNESSILLSQNERTLFNEVNDTIRINLNEPYYWEGYSGADLVSILNSSENDYLWPNEWGISSSKILDSYYLGVKVNSNNGNLIGWLKLEVDKSTGSIQILDKELTLEEYIVIDE